MSILLYLLLTTFIKCSELGHPELVVAFFRHGDRTKDAGTFYPKDPYNNVTYYPYGVGQLTDEGKLRSFYLGQQLRRQYGNYLSPHYTTDEVNAFITHYKRTKDTLKFVVQGLFNTGGIPIQNPINCQILPEDRVNPIASCPRYRQRYEQYESSDEGRKVLSKYEPHFPYIIQHTGLNITNLFDLVLIYACLRSEEEWKLKLPKWTSLVYSNYLHSATTDFFAITASLSELHRLHGGAFTKRILDNMDKKINGSTNHHKLHLYSLHDVNIVALLGAMKIYRPHLVPYSACLLLELHKISGSYYVKVLYQEYTPGHFKEMTIPGCDVLCPIESFREIVAHNLPGDQDNCNI